MSSYLEKLMEESENGRVQSRHFEDEWLAENCPEVNLWLSCEQFREKSRILPTIMLFVEDGRLKACLSDKDRRKVAFMTFESVDVLWETLESKFVEGDLDWRKVKEERRR